MAGSASASSLASLVRIARSRASIRACVRVAGASRAFAYPDGSGAATARYVAPWDEVLRFSSA